MKNFFLLLFVLTGFVCGAQFTGAYHPSKWTTTLSPQSNGTINTTSAPASITITGSDGPDATNVNTDFTITAIATGVWSFSWTYYSNDSDKKPEFDIAGVLINGTFEQLSSNTGGVDQSGHYSKPVTAGTTIGFRIQATDNIFGNATFTISSFSPPGGVLPLKLTFFTAKPQQQNVVLNWTSASEENFSHFVLERSFDGIGFSPLQTIPSNVPGHYSYVDQQPAANLLYYRLKMVDRDGSFTRSSVLSVKRLQDVAYTVFPNPAHNSLSLRMLAEKPATETLLICAASGAILKTETINLQQGINTKKLDISSLSNGVYLIRLSSLQSPLPFIKQ
jgi:hypothetical protein